MDRSQYGHPKKIFEKLQSNPGQLHSSLGSYGFEIPLFKNLSIITIPPSSAREIVNGVFVKSDAASSDLPNLLIVPEGAVNLGHANIHFGAGGNIVVLGTAPSRHLNIRIISSLSLAVFGDNEHLCNIDLTMQAGGPGGLFYCGKNVISIGVHCEVGHESGSILIGAESMVSWGVWIRSTDSHSVIDLETKICINPDKDVIIGPRVWIGQDAIILKGSKIGSGSIVGARSLVNSEIDQCVAIAGTPARVVKTNVSWTRPNSAFVDQNILNNLFNSIEKERV